MRHTPAAYRLFPKRPKTIEKDTGNQPIAFLDIPSKQRTESCEVVINAIARLLLLLLLATPFPLACRQKEGRGTSSDQHAISSLSTVLVSLGLRPEPNNTTRCQLQLRKSHAPHLNVHNFITIRSCIIEGGARVRGIVCRIEGSALKRRRPKMSLRHRIRVPC